ncbi:MAG: RluA family pseudouridine synthase [Balneolaceae bacterium]|nr:MAG: RluA family pseudouridine synthase [Balneolaceae bacterium]
MINTPKFTATEPNIEIVYEDNHLLAINKPEGVLSQEDITARPDVLTLCKSYLKKEYNKPGNVFLGLLHRLDQPVTGVMLLAKTSKAASRISEQIRKRTFRKTYLAVASGTLPASGTFRHYLQKNTSTNVVEVVKNESKNAKLAELTYTRLQESNDFSLVQINLITGRPHQIRVQFSEEGFPLLGDSKYGSKTTGRIALHAYSLTFSHPTLKNELTLTCKPMENSPLNMFSIGIHS